MDHDYVLGTLFPQSFLPMLGYVAVRHAQMDQAIDETIAHLGKMDHATATSITSAIMNLSTRLDIMRRLVITTVGDSDDQDRLFSIQLRVGELSSLRNRIMHDRQYFYSPSTQTVGYFRSDNLAVPQIKVQPPTMVTPESLRQMGDEMFMTKVWLGMYRPTFPDCPHPDWRDDGKFPWPDKLARLRSKRRQTQD